jgi:ethanolamine permease
MLLERNSSPCEMEDVLSNPSAHDDTHVTPILWNADEPIHNSVKVLELEEKFADQLGDLPSRVVSPRPLRPLPPPKQKSWLSYLLGFIGFRQYRVYRVRSGDDNFDQESGRNISSHVSYRSSSNNSFRPNNLFRSLFTSASSDDIQSVHSLPNDFDGDRSSHKLDDGNSCTNNKTTAAPDSSAMSATSGDSGTKKRIEALEFKPTFTENQTRANMFDIWIYCVTTVIGGIYYGWNEGLSAGFASYLIGQVLVGMAFVILGLSLAEIVSTVSFSGGAYGMARVVLGFYVGFLVAVFEFMEYITYTAQSAQFIGETLCDALHLSSSLVPAFALLFYVVSLAILWLNESWFWRINTVVGLVSLVIVLVYCFGSLPHVDFAQNASLQQDIHDPSASSNWFAGGMFAFMRLLPFTTWGFGGLESAALLNDMTENPRINVSYGIMWGTLTLFICTFFILFVAVSLPPGLQQFKDDCCLMNTGWSFMNITQSDALWLILPAQFGMAFGFILPASKLLRAMGTSKLLPPIYGLSESSQSKMSIVYVLVLSMCVCLIGINSPWLQLENIPILFAQFTYLSDLWAFFKLRTDFSSRENKFRNPFGIIGAGYAALMFILVAISGAFFQPSYYPPIVVAIILMLLTVYYFLYAKKHQHFSDDEQKSLLVLHVIRNNKKKKRVAATSRIARK